MHDDIVIFRNIERLGERYYKDNLDGCWKKEKLYQDWWEALKFFLSHSFMRGRKDKLSNEYYCFTIEVLEKLLSISKNGDTSHVKLAENREYFDIKPLDEFKKRIRSSGFKGSAVKHKDFNGVSDNNPLVRMLATPTEATVWWNNRSYKKVRRLDNDEDIMMVLGTLKLVAEVEYNLYEYLIQKIKNVGAREAYTQLIGIRAVADKLATFVIRDIGLLNPDIVKAGDYRYYFPVDVWVKTVAERIGYEVKDPNHARQVLIQQCEKFGINPLKFAAGLWYLGFNSLDLTIEFLSESEIT